MYENRKRIPGMSTFDTLTPFTVSVRVGVSYCVLWWFVVHRVSSHIRQRFTTGGSRPTWIGL